LLGFERSLEVNPRCAGKDYILAWFKGDRKLTISIVQEVLVVFQLAPFSFEPQNCEASI